jgi:hypothetical protein
MWMRAVLALLAAVSCSNSTPPTQTAVPTDTDTAEPNLLPTDTAAYIPVDTAVPPPPNLTPAHYVYMSQTGTWNMGSASPPFGSVTGTLAITEYVDQLDTAAPVYECAVRYVLTGEEVTQHTCADCDFVFNVEHYVSQGDPSTCNDPDTPTSGEVWQLGFDQGTAQIYFNYHGTDVWLPWYDATKTGSVVDFLWEATLAIEVEDTGM